jgi:diadenosine tetraphosphate (Ap4A) HIT family hydrolase
MNPTIEKFGYPHTLIKEHEHWLVLLRPAQVTLGSLVLAAKSDATAFGQLPANAFAELSEVIAGIEKALKAFTHYERINYLMLMMVDPHVHFHVFPRYSEPRKWNGLELCDSGWPAPPRLDTAVALDTELTAALASELALIFR